jgi:hypothetical protein
LENAEEMDKFLDAPDLPKLNQVGYKPLKSTMSNEIGKVIKILPQKSSG